MAADAPCEEPGAAGGEVPPPPVADAPREEPGEAPAAPPAAETLMDQARKLIDAKKRFPPALGAELLDHFIELGVGEGELLIAERVRVALYQKRARLEKSLATSKAPGKVQEQLDEVNDDIASMTQGISANRRPDAVRRARVARASFDREMGAIMDAASVIAGATHRARDAFRDIEQAHAEELDHGDQLAADTEPRRKRARNLPAPREQPPRRR